jgi:hypothetical protein
LILGASAHWIEASFQEVTNIFEGEMQSMGSSEVSDYVLQTAIDAAQRRQMTIRTALYHRGGYWGIDIEPADTIESVRAKLKTAIFHIR